MPKATLAFLIAVLGLQSATARSESISVLETAACFNSNKDGKFGVWIYEGYTDWREARDNPKSVLVFGFKPGRSDYAEAELEYCWYAIDVKEDTLCESGSLRVSEFTPPDRISGRYSFVLQDGRKKEGDFFASHCPRR